MSLEYLLRNGNGVGIVYVRREQGTMTGKLLDECNIAEWRKMRAVINQRLWWQARQERKRTEQAATAISAG